LSWAYMKTVPTTSRARLRSTLDSNATGRRLLCKISTSCAIASLHPSCARHTSCSSTAAAAASIPKVTAAGVSAPSLEGLGAPYSEALASAFVFQNSKRVNILLRYPHPCPTEAQCSKLYRLRTHGKPGTNKSVLFAARAFPPLHLSS